MRADLTHGRANAVFAATLAAITCALAGCLGDPGAVDEADASAPGGPDAAPGGPDAAPGAPDGGLPPLTACATPSIDRLQQWLASGEGTTVPATGSLLVPEGDGYAAKVTFVNVEWHVIVVWIANQFEAQVDLSTSAGFWLTYSATDDLYVQLRPASHWSGGDKWLTAVPSTGGQLTQRFFSFAPGAWTSLPELGTPSYTFAAALGEARGLVFVGKTANQLDVRGLRIDGHVPPCL